MGPPCWRCGPDGELFDPATPRVRPELPAGLSASDLNPDSLLDMRTVSGVAGGLVYAAVPYQAEVDILGVPRQVDQVVVLTRRPPSALSAAGPWFALSALVILAVAGLVAYRLGRRFVRPIQAAQEVTGRIAAGDLEARVPDPPGTDPELAALAGSINSMAAGLAQAKKAEQQFLQSVSHDLRTPLTSIRGFAEAIEDGVTADVVAAAGVIASEARRLERLVGDLLGLATLEARRFTLQMQPVDFGRLGGRHRGWIRPYGLRAGTGAGGRRRGARPEPLGVSGHGRPGSTGPADRQPDRERLALRHPRGPGDGAGANGRAELWVADDGPGIAAEDLNRVFERLFVARPRPDRPIGSGLGLTIVAELASAMGGSVRAESPASAGRGDPDGRDPACPRPGSGELAW